MAPAISNTLEDINSMIPYILNMPEKKFWADYDSDADILYINFKKPQQATDSEMLKNGILVRYRDDVVVGITVLDASKRKGNRDLN